MASLGKRAKQREKKERLLGTALIFFVVIIIAFAFYYTTTQSKPLNPETLCPVDGPKGHYVLLIDKTDPLNFTQKQAFSVSIKEIIEDKIPHGYLLSVFVLGEQFKDTAEPLVELCNPGDGSEKSELTANLKKLRIQYKTKFTLPLQKITESLIATESAKWSPIFEMLQLVGINGYRKHNIKGERRLIIMSDMLQNTTNFSMYKGKLDFVTFSSSDYGKKTQAELRDVEVELHYLMNSPSLQTTRNLNFWEEYFKRSGARIVEVRPIEG